MKKSALALALVTSFFMVACGNHNNGIKDVTKGIKVGPNDTIEAGAYLDEETLRGDVLRSDDLSYDEYKNVINIMKPTLELPPVTIAETGEPISSEPMGHFDGPAD